MNLSNIMLFKYTQIFFTSSASSFGRCGNRGIFFWNSPSAGSSIGTGTLSYNFLNIIVFRTTLLISTHMKIFAIKKILIEFWVIGKSCGVHCMGKWFMCETKKICARLTQKYCFTLRGKLLFMASIHLLINKTLDPLGKCCRIHFSL